MVVEKPPVVQVKPKRPPRIPKIQMSKAELRERQEMEMSKRKLSLQENRKGEILSSVMDLTPDSLQGNTNYAPDRWSHGCYVYKAQRCKHDTYTD